MKLSLPLTGLVGLTTVYAQSTTSSSKCGCGFVDPSNQRVYTESIIVYFNETDALDGNIFQPLDYRKRVQKGWNTIFRQGADPSNFEIGNYASLPWQNAADGNESSLQMFLDAPTYNHDSVGAELRSVRQDILFGTFRASMRSAQPWTGGSAISMYLQYNDSSVVQMDMLNKDMAPDAQIMQTVNGEWPENSLAVNYSIIQAGAPPALQPRSPWDFLDLRIDWTMDSVEFWIENNNTRNATLAQRTIPSIPAPLTFSHWSTGDSNYMQGPPLQRSVANVQWVRAFFNSSMMSAADHDAYDQRCLSIDPCSVDDITLRDSSSYLTAATLPWEPPAERDFIRKIAGYIAAAFSTFGVASLLNAFVRRTPWSKVKKIYWPSKGDKSSKALRKSIRSSMGPIGSPPTLHEPMPALKKSETSAQSYMNYDSGSSTGNQTPAPGYTTPSGMITPLPVYQSRVNSPRQSVTALVPIRRASVRRNHSVTGMPDGKSTPSVPHSPTIEGNVFEQPAAIDEAEELDGERAQQMTYLNIGAHHVENEQSSASSSSSTSGRTNSKSNVHEQTSELSSEASSETSSVKDIKHLYPTSSEEKKAMQTAVDEIPSEAEIVNEKSLHTMIHEKSVPDAMTGAATIEPKAQKSASPKRIDHLAGLLAISCIMVTLRHFSLTFWPHVTEGYGLNEHFAADHVLSYILGPYVLTPFWIGPFFVTACRFLAQKYIKTGRLDDMGNRMLLRAPRMLIPCFIFMLLEYFLISLGLTTELESLPSVSFSVWPYVEPQKNFGVWLNQAIELAYLFPNAAPAVINNYCVGILWTIPVQLQFSFVTIVATIMIRDIKTPYKRIGFYILTILAGWYATSWSATHWLGLMLADMDLSYDWIKWTQAKWYRLYPILLFALAITGAGPLALLFNSNVFDFPFMSWENAIHPDPVTGKALIQVADNVLNLYPDYFNPSLAVLAFSIGLQVMVELSTWIQWFLSLPIVTFFHPHIMTIYCKSSLRRSSPYTAQS
jgi:hypothetical protein